LLKTVLGLIWLGTTLLTEKDMVISDRHADSEQLLVQYDRVVADISALEHVLASLRNRRSTIEYSLESITRPSDDVFSRPKGDNSNCRVKALPQDQMQKGSWYKGEFTPTTDKVSAYLYVMTRLLNDHTDLQARIADRVNAGARRRRYLARNLSGLHPSKTEVWVMAHSADLGNGWYADKNLSGERMQSILERAVSAVGLEVGRDAGLVW
jgi:hypothetical protein